MYKLLSRGLGAQAGPADEEEAVQAEVPRWRTQGEAAESVSREQLYCELCRVFISDPQLHMQKPRHARLEEAFRLHYAQTLRSLRRETRRPSRAFGLGRRLRRLRGLTRLYCLKP